MRERFDYLQKQRQQHVPRAQRRQRYNALMKDLSYEWTNRKHIWNESCNVCSCGPGVYVKCLICYRNVTPNNVAIHDDYNRNSINTICKHCVREYGW